jgi:hypothetical protein
MTWGRNCEANVAANQRIAPSNSAPTQRFFEIEGGLKAGDGFVVGDGKFK